MTAPSKVALVVDWLQTYAGSERVVEQILHCYPDADLFAVVDFLPAGERGFIQNKPVYTTYIQHWPFAKKHFRHYLAFMPRAIEQLDLRGYDLVISSSHAVAKGVITGPDQVHVSYVHSPMRYAWDLQQEYFEVAGLKGPKRWLASRMLYKLRQWDYIASQRVDHLIGNSQYIARRIEKCYRRSADVIYPPVSVDQFACNADKQDYYVTASRMVPYKRIDLIVQAFARMPDKRLVVIGDGPEFTKIKQLATGNIELLGYQSDKVLKQHLATAKAFVFAATEDFGILPVEAQACGTPVIAYGVGGAKETVLPLGHNTPTGVFFDQQTPEAINAAVQEFELHAEQFSAKAIRKHAEKFSVGQFRKQFMAYVEGLLSS